MAHWPKVLQTNATATLCVKQTHLKTRGRYLTTLLPATARRPRRCCHYLFIGLLCQFLASSRSSPIEKNWQKNSEGEKNPQKPQWLRTKWATGPCEMHCVPSRCDSATAGEERQRVQTSYYFFFKFNSV